MLRWPTRASEWVRAQDVRHFFLFNFDFFFFFKLFSSLLYEKSEKVPKLILKEFREANEDMMWWLGRSTHAHFPVDHLNNFRYQLYSSASARFTFAIILSLHEILFFFVDVCKFRNYQIIKNELSFVNRVAITKIFSFFFPLSSRMQR